MGKDRRKEIGVKTRLKLWVKSGGRCEMKHCNKIVYRHSMTLSDGNFADVAHIIGSSKDGPRGNDESEELQTDFSNLMLLCKECHKEIDSYEEQYGIDLLRQWKQEHEERIEFLTSHVKEGKTSTILRMQINIGDRKSAMNNEAIYNAMFQRKTPRFPADPKGIFIDENFDRNADASIWEYFAQNNIKKKLDRYLEVGIDEIPTSHISIFGLAPMPFLMYLGRCVGDIIPCDIYQAQRNIDDTNDRWVWNKSVKVNHLPVKQEMVIKSNDSDTVLILFEVSDNISNDKVETILKPDMSVYKIFIDKPTPHYVQSPKQIEDFSKIFRELLNNIQKEHGRNCKILLLPALPVSFAIETGRVLLPTKDPYISVCEYSQEQGFREVLRLC